MKPFIQKLQPAQDNSFVSKTFKTPHFEVTWHQHIEYELILFTEGKGMSFVGNYVGEFKRGDIFFLGSNLPHTFQKQHKDDIVSAMVIQFREDIIGESLLNFPESRLLRQLFQISAQGLKINGHTKNLLKPLIKELEHVTGFKRIAILCECLSILENSKDYERLSTQPLNQLNNKSKNRLDRVFQHTIHSFKKPIDMDEIAAIAGLSKPAFCSYFKKRTNKTYISFLNEIRIGYACKLLMNSSLNITEICYDAGYNSIANFNKQFLKVKSVSPSKYRALIQNTD
jgi:AraC-like DNA-binding protein